MKLLAATTLALGAEAIVGQEGTMHEAFDSLTRFAKRLPTAKYPSKYWTAITECMATTGDTLYPSASDAAWDGWTQFGINGGTPNDLWSVNNTGGFREYDPRNMTFRGDKFPIIEPCNTLSNLAFYRILPDICINRNNLVMGDEYVNAIIGGFATLGMGSSFMHGSRTHLGATFDNTPIGVIAYQYAQLMTASLTVGVNGTDSVLHELSPTPRAYDGRVLANKLITIPLDFEIGDWNQALKDLDVPDYFFTFSAIIVNAVTLLLPDSIADVIIQAALKAFGNMVGPDVADFILHTYVETLRGAIDFQLTLAAKEALLPVFLGTVMKLLWAFVWQEQTFVYSLVFNAEWNLIGNLVTPTLFKLANNLTKFEHDDSGFQQGTATYPGQSYCNVKASAPHAKWHEISATGLVDMAFMSDAVRAAINNAQAQGSAHLGQAATEDDVFISTNIFDDWAAEIQAEPWSEAYVTRQGFVAVVKGIVNDADACGSGSADGSITNQELACYIEGVDSFTSFIQSVFDGVKAHVDSSLSAAHRAPASKEVFV